jgi:HK97 family phage major capsid protein
MLNRAHALFLDVKSIDDEERVIEGIASTPTPDRMGDVMDPLGAEFTLPMPFLWQHGPREPIGEVFYASPEHDGIRIKARVSRSETPGPLRDRLEEAWQSFKAMPPLVRGLSIDWAPRKFARIPGSTYTRHTKWLWAGLSAVTIPANVEATITRVKSLAAPPRQEKTTMATMTAAEQILSLEQKRATHVSRMAAIMTTAREDNRICTPDEAKEHDGLALEVKSYDDELGRCRSLEQLQRSSATVVPQAATPFSFVSVKENVEPGITFARYVIAKLGSRYADCDAATYAEKRWGASNNVALALKAAVLAGSTTDATWAKPLVNPAVTSDFLPLLRAATILGKISGLQKRPFNVNIPAQTAGAVAQWVGELKPKPVSAMAFAMESLPFHKVASIVVLSQELVRFSNPSAEAVVRDSLVKDIAAYLDAQFINPAVAAVVGVSPASITNGAPTAAATANPLADIMGLINHFATNNIPIDGLTFILSPTNALALSFRTNLDGSPEFPGIGINGGTYKGLQFITSNIATTNVVALAPQYILYADDGGVTIDASTEASLQMDSAPASPPDATTVYASMFQMNAVALRAEQFITWKRIGANTVKYLTAAAWPAPTGTIENGSVTAAAKAKRGE